MVDSEAAPCAAALVELLVLLPTEMRGRGRGEFGSGSDETSIAMFGVAVVVVLVVCWSVAGHKGGSKPGRVSGTTIAGIKLDIVVVRCHAFKMRSSAPDARRSEAVSPSASAGGGMWG